jgi:hypothetical protein
MQQNDTLSPAQVTALAELLAGRTITDAATVAGVDRVTVHRWLREDYAFQAAWNRDRRELRRAAYNRLERLAAKSAECLEKAIDGGDVKAALEIVKGMGILAPSPIGSEDASELAIEATERKDDLKTRAMFASFGSGRIA